MFRRIPFFAIVLFITGLLVTAALAYEVKEMITLDRPEGNTKLNIWVGKVKFPHGFHTMRVPCGTCHHKATDDTLGEFVACRQCHTDEDPTEESGFYRAWHSEGPPSCLGCHTQNRARGGKNPVGCTSACHKPA